jgi:hypothetical protein
MFDRSSLLVVGSCDLRSSRHSTCSSLGGDLSIPVEGRTPHMTWPLHVSNRLASGLEKRE